MLPESAYPEVARSSPDLEGLSEDSLLRDAMNHSATLAPSRLTSREYLDLNDAGNGLSTRLRVA